MVLTKATFHDYDKMLERKEIEEKADDPVGLILMTSIEVSICLKFAVK